MTAILALLVKTGVVYPNRMREHVLLGLFVFLFLVLQWDVIECTLFKTVRRFSVTLLILTNVWQAKACDEGQA